MDVVEVLLDDGADHPDPPDLYDFYYRNQTIPLIKAILGRNMHVTYESLNVILQFSIKIGHLEMVEYLLDNHNNVLDVQNQFKGYLNLNTGSVTVGNTFKLPDYYYPQLRVTQRGMNGGSLHMKGNK